MIIGISGKKGHGKDTIALIIQWLIEYPNGVNKTDSEGNRSFNSFVMDIGMGHKPVWQKKMFAEKVKQIVCILLGCTMEQLEDQSFKEKELGEEWRVYWYNVYGETEQVLWREIQLEEKFFYITKGHYARFDKSVLLTPRLLMQLIGTDCGRQIVHPNIWVNATMNEYKAETLHKRDISESRELRNWVVPKRADIPERFWGTKCSTPTIVWTDYDNPAYPNWIITDVRFPNEVKAIKDRGGYVIRIERPDIGYTGDHFSETALDSYTDWDMKIGNGSVGDWQGRLIEVMQVFLQSHKII